MREGPYRQGFSLERWQQRFQQAMSSRFALRLHMTLLMLGVLGVGVLAGRVLRPLVPSMGLRYGLQVLLGYATFFGLVRLWLGYAAKTLLAELPAETVPPEARALVGVVGEPVPEASALTDRSDPGDDLLAVQVAADLTNAVASSTPSARAASAVDPASIPATTGASSSGGGLDLGGADGEGFVVVVVVGAIVAVLLAIFGAAALSVWQAPAILGEAAFEVVLGASLARAARRLEGRNWARSLWRATWGRSLVLLLIASAAGLAVQSVCPGVETLGEAISQCVRSRPS